MAGHCKSVSVLDGVVFLHERRGVGRSVAIAAAVMLMLVACSSSHSSQPSAPTTPTTRARPDLPDDMATLRGTARMDGNTFDADFIGAVVMKDGLVTPCQVTIPSIDH